MPARKPAMRKCMGCMQMFPKQELVRVVRTRTGEQTDEVEISLDPTGKKAGRGAYLCRNTACLQQARKAKRLSRALDCVIPEAVYERLEQELKQNE